MTPRPERLAEGTPGMKVLFLDIDGALNAHEPLDPEVMCGRIHPDKVVMLNNVLRATGAVVVLSSAWRYIVHRGEATLAGMDWLLRSHGVMAGRLVGITGPDTMHDRCPAWNGSTPWPVADERGAQITDYIQRQIGWANIDRYAVVDDLDLGISAAGHPLVLTNGQTGLTSHDADELIELLNGKAGAL